MKNKKIILSILLFTFVVLFTNVNAASVVEMTTGTDGDYTYTVYLENGKYWAELNTYTGTSTSPVIPTTIGSNYAVTKLGSNLFKNNRTIKTIVVPDNIIVIGSNAFINCSNLSTVYLSNNLIEIGAYAFENCDSLKSITIPKTVDTAMYIFYNCDNLTNVVLEKGMTTIPYRIFYNTLNPNLIVTIPNTITKIGESAFYNSAISNINIPNSVTTIGDMAFASCDNITSITLPNNLTTIGSAAFSDCDRLKSITIPKTVKSAKYAVEMCDNLTSVILEEGMTTIPNSMLAYTSNPNLVVTIPNTIVKIGEAAFYNSNILNLSIPKSVTTIADRAFYGCSNITSITLPNNLTTMGNEVFFDCDGLTSITIPKTVTSGKYIFENCDNLTKVVLESGMTAIPQSMLSYITNPNLVVIIPNTVKTINAYAFKNSTILSLTLPASITTINNNAFELCTNLTNLTVPYGVSYIGESAFYGWTNTQTINFELNKAYSGWDSNWNKNCNAVIKYGNRGTKFTDVKLTDFYFLAVEYCSNNKIINGTSSTTFAPSNKVTRGMVATMLYSMAGAPKVTGTCKFTDVSSSKYYYNAILWASQNKVLNGYSGTTKFGPNDYVTREQLAVMLTSFAIYKKKYTASNVSLAKFTDASKVSSWATSAVKWATANKIINGSNGKINPKGHATRAEVATMLYSYYLNIK